MIDNKSKFILLIALALGIFLRVYNLQKESLVLDEAQSVWQASHSVDFILKYSAQNVHLPLHNLILHFWMNVFGSSEASVRALAVIPGILVLPFVYLLAYEITKDPKKSLLAFVLAALSPFWVWYSREIRMYTLLILFVTLSYYLFLRLLSTGKSKYMFFYIVINILGTYTHYFFNLALLVQGTHILLSLYNNWLLGDKKRKIYLLGKFAFSWILSLIALSIWVAYYIRNNQGGSLSPNLDVPRKFDIVYSLFNFTFGYQPDSVSTLLISLWPLLALYGFVFLTRRTEVFTPKIYFLILGVFLPIIVVYVVSITVRPIFLTRYLVAVTPLFLVMLSWLLMQTKGFFGRSLTALALFTYLAANYNQYTRADIPQKEDYRSALSYIEGDASVRDVIVASPPYTYFPIHYYAKASVKISTLPVWNRKELNIPEVSDERVEADIVTIKDGHSRVYLISTLNLSGAPEVLYYMDHNYTRLNQQKMSENVWVSVYQAEYPWESQASNMPQVQINN